MIAPRRCSSLSKRPSRSLTIGNLAFKGRFLYLQISVTATDANHGAVLTLEHLTEQVGQGVIDTVLLALTDMQGRLQGKRLTAQHFLDEVAHHGAEGCNYLLAVDVEMNTVDGYAMSSWEQGYGDFAMRPDLATLRPVPWHEGTVLCLADLEWADGSPVVASPRQVLKAQLARLAERGWTANASTELEFLVFRNSYEEAWRKAYRELEPANLYNIDYSLVGTAKVEPLIRRWKVTRWTTKGTRTGSFTTGSGHQTFPRGHSSTSSPI